MLRVLRMTPGDRFLAFNANAGEWECEIKDSSRDCVMAVMIRQIRECKSSRKLALAICQIKPENMRLILEKCTELGATDFYLLTSEYTNYHSDIAKLRRIAISAAEQSERLDIPTIYEEVPLDKFVSDLPSEYTWFSAIERETNACSLLEIINTHCKPFGFIVGPEGGFSDDEKTLLHTTTTPLRLSPNILRSETAAIMCAAAGGMGQFNKG